MKTIGIFYFVLSFFFLGCLFSSCELFEDDEHCNESWGDVSIWDHGDFVDAYWVRDYDLGGGAIYYASLGGNEFIHLTDVCTSHDVTISAEVQINPEAWTTHGVNWKCYLVLKNGFVNVGSSNLMAMARTNLEDNSLRIEPIQIPVTPSFETSLIEGTLDAWVAIKFPKGFYCDLEEAHSKASELANLIVKKATIIVEYTIY